MNLPDASPTPQAGHIHIDRIRVAGPLEHPALGQLWYQPYDDLGGFAPVAASAPRPKRNPAPDDIYVHSTKVQGNGRANEFVMECCPPQLLQDCNFFGHADMRDYVYAVFMQQIQKHGINVHPDQLDEWSTGQVGLSLVHLTGNFWMAPSAKLPVIDAIDQNNPRGKHRAIPSCITLGFTEKRRSRHYMVTIYDKHLQLLKMWPRPTDDQKRILELARGSIRVEIKIYDEGLKELGLEYVMRWEDVDVDALFFELLTKFDVRNSIQQLLTEDEVNMLPPSLRRAYLLWLNNVDLNKEYHRCTVAKYIKAILEATTVNMKAHRRPDKLPVIDLGEALTPDNLVAPPDWLAESSMYVAPRSARTSPRSPTNGRLCVASSFSSLHPYWA
jgi:hypothetical protein